MRWILGLDGSDESQQGLHYLLKHNKPGDVIHLVAVRKPLPPSLLGEYKRIAERDANMMLQRNAKRILSHSVVRDLLKVL
jgi:hypothetical protein